MRASALDRVKPADTFCAELQCDDALYKLMFYLLTYLLTIELRGNASRGNDLRGIVSQRQLQAYRLHRMHVTV